MKKLLLLLALVMLGSAQANAQQAISVANEAITGTTVGKLAKLTGAPSTAILTGTGDLDGIVGIVVAQDATATTGNAKIAVLGPANCTFDASGVTAGHYVINSTLTAGDCADGGASRPTANQVLGRALATVVSGTASVELERNFTNAAGSGSPANPTATITTSAVNGVAATFMRSDAAPAISQCSSSTFGACKVDGTTITASGGVISSVSGGAGTVTQNGNLTTGKLAIGGTNGTTDITVDANAGISAGALSLGASGTVGTVGLGNATSGTVTLGTVTGALGSVTASFPANTGTLAELNLSQAWTAGQAITPDTATQCGTQSAAGTMTPNFALSNSCVATFGAGNLTIANPTNVKAGQSWVLSLIQDGVGSRTVTWGGNFKFAGATAPTLSTTASAKDVISCFADTTTTINCTLAVKGAS